MRCSCRIWAPNWTRNVFEAKDILLRGKESYEQINILGDDGVPLDYHLRYWKSELIDFAILQQDAFDKIDASSSLERQNFMLEKVLEICHKEFRFDSFEEVSPYFKKIINALKQMNYSIYESDEFVKNQKALEKTLAEREVVAEEA